MAHTPQEIRVGILLGGDSHEREVSLASGHQVERALNELGYSVTKYDPSNKDDLLMLASNSPNVVFNALHGPNGEDGIIQGFLEMLKIPYTGSGVLGSALAMDKSISKIMYQNAKIPTPQSILVSRGEEHSASQLLKRLGEKVVVKPVDDGSSIGFHIVSSPQELEDALDEEFDSFSKILIETYIQGMEVTVSVLDMPSPTPLPVIEIVPVGHEFYNFESKYSEGGSQHIIPARLNEKTYLLAQQYAVQAHQALQCSGVSRSDMLIEKDGSIWVLETNTIPGMTKTSLLPDAARFIGVDFNQLCYMLIDQALQKNLYR